VSQGQALRLGSILWIMLQVCFQLPGASGRRRQRLVSQDMALRLRSILPFANTLCMYSMSSLEENLISKKRNKSRKKIFLFP
jgi:hypothetical protein